MRRHATIWPRRWRVCKGKQPVGEDHCEDHRCRAADNEPLRTTSCRGLKAPSLTTLSVLEDIHQLAFRGHVINKAPAKAKISYHRDAPLSGDIQRITSNARSK